MTAPSIDLLRFITAGSVDDGKSTLIGRLLYDSKALSSDQTEALVRSGSDTSTSEEEKLDFSSLTDGLEAEREQGITIDVAYRYFRTERRRFIIADAPGHEQYTRNMVTGASTADAAIILIDAAKVKTDPRTGKVTLLDQTKRHTALVRLLGLPHVIGAVNKVDLLDYDETAYRAIAAAFGELARTLGIASVHLLPISALRGDNVVRTSAHTPWYAGPPLLELLETLPLRPAAEKRPEDLRFPVQLVVREGGSTLDDFRGYMGRVEGGRIARGQRVRVLPGGFETTVSEVLRPEGHASEGEAGDILTLRLTDDIDISRGDLLVDAGAALEPVNSIRATLCWFDPAPLDPRRKLLFRQTTNTVPARIASVDRVLDVKTLSHGEDRSDFGLNDIGTVTLRLQKPVACDPYDDNPKTGSFILVDQVTNRTLAAGMVERIMVEQAA